MLKHFFYLSVSMVINRVNITIMNERDIRLDLEFRGSVLDCRVTVDGENMGKWGFDKATKLRFKELDAYAAGETLEVEVITKGKNGAAALLTVTVEGQEPVVIESVVEKGITQTHETIVIEDRDE